MAAGRRSSRLIPGSAHLIPDRAGANSRLAMLRELAPKGLFYLNYFLAEIALVTGKSKKIPVRREKPRILPMPAGGIRSDNGSDLRCPGQADPRGTIRIVWRPRLSGSSAREPFAPSGRPWARPRVGARAEHEAPAPLETGDPSKIAWRVRNNRRCRETRQ